MACSTCTLNEEIYQVLFKAWWYSVQTLGSYMQDSYLCLDVVTTDITYTHLCLNLLLLFTATKE
jgi:hypothetical protein